MSGMDDLAPRPFSCKAPPFFAKQVSDDVAEKGRRAVGTAPASFYRIGGVPHAQRAARIAMWRVGWSVRVDVRGLGRRQAEDDRDCLDRQVRDVEPDLDGEATSVSPEGKPHLPDLKATVGEPAQEQDAGRRPGEPGRLPPWCSAGHALWSGVP